ncbi:MAG: SAM-dependent methyltransferase [Armatimonas sp.]
MRPNTPSATARMVARGVVYIATDPLWRHLVPPEMATLTRTLLAVCSPTERRWLAMQGRPVVRGLIAFTEQLTVPGILCHYVLRKLYLDAATEKALQDGFRQVVILGAGLDTLALRLHQTYPDVSFIEVDHPATQQCKRAIIPADQPNLHLIAADLGHANLSAVLSNCSAFNFGDDTLFLAEGLLMYLSPWQVRTLLSNVRDAVLPSARCRLGFTYVEPYLDGHPDFTYATRALRLWLQWRGEPFRWGIYRDQLPSLLARHGFTLRATATPEELREPYQSPPHVNGDSICLADRN